MDFNLNKPEPKKISLLCSMLVYALTHKKRRFVDFFHVVLRIKHYRYTSEDGTCYVRPFMTLRRYYTEKIQQLETMCFHIDHMHYIGSVLFIDVDIRRCTYD